MMWKRKLCRRVFVVACLLCKCGEKVSVSKTEAGASPASPFAESQACFLRGTKNQLRSCLKFLAILKRVLSQNRVQDFVCPSGAISGLG